MLKASSKMVPRPPAPPPRARGTVALLQPGSGPADERWAMAVLARHSARLGASGARLEAAVQAAVAGHEDVAGCWAFLESREGTLAFQTERRRFEAIYARQGRTPPADVQVRGLLAREGPSARERALPAPPATTCSRTEGTPVPQADGYIELPTHEVRFAHDDQSEHFGRGPQPTGGGQSLLQLAVELLAGLTALEDVPEFTICRHQGQWYCRSGNRRLGALRLCRRFAPGRFGYIRVRAVATDKIFTHGAPGRRPKLTTNRNGEDCEGQWMFIRETGETVGYSGGAGSEEYGADLLALLPIVRGDEGEDDWDLAAGGA